MRKKHVPLVFGQETEFSLVIFDQAGKRVETADAATMFMKWTRKSCVHVNSGTTDQDIFLEDGSRSYIDSGNKIEKTTPECRTGVEIATYDRAGRRVLAKIAARLEFDNPGYQVQLNTNAVDYSAATTCGCHESYLTFQEPSLELAEPVLPFLATRSIIVGSGGFDATAPGLEFTLSPRASFITCNIGQSTTRNRSLFCLKDEPLAARFKRTHLLLGESLCSDLGTYLKFSLTAAVIRLSDLGRLNYDPVALANPVAAYHKVAKDSTCKVSLDLANGGTANPIEIQRHYIAQIGRHVRAGYLPGWVMPACYWAEWILNKLEIGESDALVKMLDWPLKRKIFADYAATFLPRSWREISAWSQFLKNIVKLTGFHKPFTDMPPLLFELIVAELEGDSRGRMALNEIFQALNKSRLTYQDFLDFMEMSYTLMEYDMKLCEVRGFYRDMENAGILGETFISKDVIRHAENNPPQWGRAKIRGEWIKENGPKGRMAIADWNAIKTPEGHLDLRDVFATTARWVSA